MIFAGVAVGLLLLDVIISQQRPTVLPPKTNSETETVLLAQIEPTSTNPIQQSEKNKAYKNTELGISFDYPSNLFIIEEVGAVSITSIPPDDLRRQSSASMGNMTLQIFKGKTVEEVKNALASNTLSSRETTVGKDKAIELISLPDGYSGGTWISLLVNTDVGVLEIQYLNETQYIKTYKSIIESIKIM